MIYIVLLILLCLGSALSYAVSATFKHRSAAHVPAVHGIDPSSMKAFALGTLRQPAWWGGIVADTAGLGLQLTALHLGALAIVQPLLLSGLVFALVIGRMQGRPTSRSALLWAALIVAGLCVFLDSSGTLHALTQPADSLPAVLASVIGVVAVATSLVIATRASTTMIRSAAAGIGAGIAFAATAALLKALTAIAVVAPAHVLLSWPIYAVICTGGTGMFLTQLSFQDGALATGLAAAAITDPLVAIVLGVAVFDEHLRWNLTSGAAMSASLLVLIFAVTRLATHEQHATIARKELPCPTPLTPSL